MADSTKRSRVVRNGYVSLGFDNAESTSYLGVCIHQGVVRSDLRRQGWHENEVETINSDPPFEKLNSAEKKRKS